MWYSTCLIAFVLAFGIWLWPASRTHVLRMVRGARCAVCGGPAWCDAPLARISYGLGYGHTHVGSGQPHMVGKIYEGTNHKPERGRAKRSGRRVVAGEQLTLYIS